LILFVQVQGSLGCFVAVRQTSIAMAARSIFKGEEAPLYASVIRRSATGRWWRHRSVTWSRWSPCWSALSLDTSCCKRCLDNAVAAEDDNDEDDISV